MDNFFLFLFCIICVQLTIAADVDKSEKHFTPCGLYGFRCLNEKRAQICNDNVEDYENSPRPRIFDCAEGLICDEEKKEFCSPRDSTHNSTSCNCSDMKIRKKKSKKNRKRGWNDLLDDDKESTTMAVKTTGGDDDDDEQPNTEEPEVDPWNGSPPISCTTYGFFPDNANNSLFFFCDVKKNGKDFILRHMRCGPNRVFDANFKACILKGTTRSARRDKSCSEPKIINQPKFSDFNCTNKKPGKYPDSQDCTIYHLCLSEKLYEPFQHLTVECPHTTAFDPLNQKCSKKGGKFCKKILNSNVFCETEIRFRETRSCDRYFLCYRELVVEFSCPPGFHFDEKLQFCITKRRVKCE